MILTFPLVSVLSQYFQCRLIKVDQRLTADVYNRSTMKKFIGTIYKTDLSPPARTVLMVADLLGLKMREQEMNPVLREQDAPDMLKKNPMKTIPIYEEGDISLGDSHAIILYLFEKYAKPEHSYLYPTDLRKRAMINNRLFFDCGILFPRLRAIMALTYFGKLTELTNSMKRNNEDAYGMLEMYLADTKYLADNVITLGDISVLTTISTLHGLQPINKTRYPKLFNWYENMSGQDFSKRINQPGAELHAAGLISMMEYNRTKLNSKI